MRRLTTTILACIAVFSTLTIALASESKSAALSDSDIKLIDDILFAIRIEDFARELPAQINQGFRQRSQEGAHKFSEKEIAEFEQLTNRIFSPDAMMQHITDTLKNNFDKEHYQKVLDTVTSPFGLRMTELEAKKPVPSELAAYLAKIAIQPLPAARLALINSLDESSRTSELATKLATSTIHTIMQAALGNCPKMLAEMDKNFAAQHDEFQEDIRNSVRAAMAYTYRDVSDADLQKYVDQHNDADMRWFFDLLFKAINEEFRINAERMGIGIQEMLKNKPNTRFSHDQCDN